jgi:hypothetical protein
VNNGLNEFQRALQDYTRYNRRELGPLLEARARRVQFELFRQFKSIAPTKEKINAEAEARGYRIRRREGEDGRKVSLKKELALRRKSIGFLSISFLIRAWKAQREGQNAAFSARSRKQAEIGKTVLHTAKGTSRPQVRIMSFLEGVVVQNRRRALVDKALKLQAADMRTYVARKQRQEFQRRAGGFFKQLIRL